MRTPRRFKVVILPKEVKSSSGFIAGAGSIAGVGVPTLVIAPDGTVCLVHSVDDLQHTARAYADYARR